MKSLALILALFSAPAFATVAHDCEGLNDIGMLLESKSFEKVKVAHVSTEEPAAAPDHLLVFVYDYEMGYACTALSLADGIGYYGIDFESLRSVGYDGKKGRLFEITVYPADHNDGGRGAPQIVRFRANALTSKVTLE